MQMASFQYRPTVHHEISLLHYLPEINGLESPFGRPIPTTNLDDRHHLSHGVSNGGQSWYRPCKARPISVMGRLSIVFVYSHIHTEATTTHAIRVRNTCTFPPTYYDNYQQISSSSFHKTTYLHLPVALTAWVVYPHK